MSRRLFSEEVVQQSADYACRLEQDPNLKLTAREVAQHALNMSGIEREVLKADVLELSRRMGERLSGREKTPEIKYRRLGAVAKKT